MSNPRSRRGNLKQETKTMLKLEESPQWAKEPILARRAAVTWLTKRLVRRPYPKGKSLQKVDGLIEIPYISKENADEDPKIRVSVKDEGLIGNKMTRFRNIYLSYNKISNMISLTDSMAGNRVRRNKDSSNFVPSALNCYNAYLVYLLLNKTITILERDHFISKLYMIHDYINNLEFFIQ